MNKFFHIRQPLLHMILRAVSGIGVLCALLGIFGNPWTSIMILLPMGIEFLLAIYFENILGGVYPHRPSAFLIGHAISSVLFATAAYYFSNAKLPVFALQFISIYAAFVIGFAFLKVRKW